jgi:hypothetical protein
MFVALAFGQQVTERFIPIGQSPGVSSKMSIMGTVESVDAAKRTLMVTGQAGAQTWQITDKTQIWTDRSAKKEQNQTGTLGDLQKGRKVEIKPGQGDAKATAVWIKVQM